MSTAWASHDFRGLRSAAFPSLTVIARGKRFQGRSKSFPQLGPGRPLAPPGSPVGPASAGEFVVALARQPMEPTSLELSHSSRAGLNRCLRCSLQTRAKKTRLASVVLSAVASASEGSSTGQRLHQGLLCIVGRLAAARLRSRPMLPRSSKRELISSASVPPGRTTPNVRLAARAQSRFLVMAGPATM